MYLKLNFFRLLLSVFTLFFTVPLNGQSVEEGSVRRNDFKVTMLSLGSGSSRFTYERAFSSLTSAELTIGVIGLGWDWMNKQSSQGVLLKTAYKWRIIPQGTSNSWLAGFYLKPELVLASFQYDDKSSTSSDYVGNEYSSQESQGKNTKQLALLAEGGYQFVFKWFVLDLYAGLGPSLGTGNDNNYFHSFMLFPKESWMAVTAGYRVGFAF